MLSHAVIIPCYNEVERFKISDYREFIKSHRDVLLCFVNDGSTDNTLQILRLLKDHYPNQIQIIENPHNVGKGEAVRTGINKMLNGKELQHIGFLDADLSTGLSDYSEMLEQLKNNSVVMVFASRKTGGGNEISTTLFRYWAGKIARFIIRRIIKLPVTDTQCGAKIFSKEAASICFGTGFETRWLFDVEIFLRLKKAKGADELAEHISEFYLKKWTHEPKSKLKFTDVLSGPLQLLKIMVHYKINPFF
jgi:glycosyltransferase involved in cell wall biosynthesis